MAEHVSNEQATVTKKNEPTSLIVKSAFITHTVFVLLNVLIVLTGIFLPRLINQPKIVIEGVSTHFDEDEYLADPTTVFEVRAVGFESGISYSCSQHFRFGIVPSHCASEVEAEAGVQIVRLEKQLKSLKEDEAYYSGLMFLEKDELLSELSGEQIKSRENSILLSVVLLEDYAKPEREGNYLQQLTSILLNSIVQSRRQREKELEAVKSLLSEVAKIELTNLKRSGDAEIEIIVSNQGYADAIASSEGSLSLNGVTVPLISLKRNTYSADERGNYTIIPSKDVVRLTYTVDSGAISENGRQVLQQAIISKAAVQFQAMVKIGTEYVSTTGNFSTKTRSLDFGE